MKLPLPPRQAYAAAILSALLLWLAFPGTDVWPLAFVAFVPLWIAIRGQTPKRALVLGFVAGTVGTVGGFYWLLNMLRTFSGFATPLCIFFMVILCAYQGGGRYGSHAWLAARLASRGWPAEVGFAAAFVASELLFPLLFPWYIGAMVHQVPVLAQSAELGGPILVGLMIVAVNIAVAELILARLERRAIERRCLAAGGAALGLALLFGALRIPSVDAHAARAPAVHVGVVQGNLALMQKREDPREGLRRHLRMSAELKAKGADLVVWSETSATFPMRESKYKDLMPAYVSQKIGLPAIFGAVLYRVDPDRERWFNTALSSDSQGAITGRYDKEYLLAFGEYLPLGDTFPILYQWSPNSGRFSAGKTLDPLVVELDGHPHNVTTLICYEDILPAFTNKAVAAEHPELLVNMTNDAWFGDTTEPWEHLALAQLRTIEHRRYLVRGTNSGVSAIVDPVGRVLVHSGTFRAETIEGTVHLMQASTVYEVLGDIPWWIVSLLALLGAFARRKPAGLPEEGKAG